MKEEDLMIQENPMEKIHTKSIEEVFVILKTRKEGLTEDEVKLRQEQDGKNILKETKGKSVILIFLSNFIGLMAILLWIGGFIALLAGMLQLSIAIWMVNVINGVFSFWQEYRAGKAINALKKMLPNYVRVVRDKQEIQLLAEELVVGDIIVVEEGDKISADARLINCSNFQANQSILTGEVNPVRKTKEAVLREDLSRSEISNLIFTGTSVASGTGIGVVIATGMNTEFGKIANLTQSMKEEKSPLQKELDTLTKQISVMALSIGIFFFFSSVFLVKEPVLQSFIFALGMIVAFIPEGLLPTVTLSLAMAVQRMAKENALVKRLSAVETLGCTTVICSDKTGTLTQNEMTVSNLWLPGMELEVTGLGYEPVGKILSGTQEENIENNPDLKMLLSASSLCSNARLVPPKQESEKYTVLGDPTEACLEVVARKAGLDVKIQNEKTPRVRELPFDSRRKRMTTIHQLENIIEEANLIAYVKGAPKEVLELSTRIYKQGKPEDLIQQERNTIMQANDRYARRGLRVLGIAFRPLSPGKEIPVALSAYTPENIEKELVFIGLVIMADPPRPEVADAVKLCHRAKIRIVMITGDYGLTAESIAKRIGIVEGSHPKILSGVEIEKISDDELKEALKGEVIFARVTPEQKYRVVYNLQEMGEIVAVTGDGVNDSPALKKADIGVAMGIAGTDVAKEAAEMILLDDNFASIVKAIEEGRAVYSNIRKFILYILNSNMSEGVPSGFFLFSKGKIPLPLTVMQILAVDLGTDMVPALALGTELPEKGIMDIPPRSRKEKLMTKEIFFKAFLWYGLIASILSMGAYFYVNILNGWPSTPLANSGEVYQRATSMTLGAIVFCQIGAVLNCRTVKQSVFKIGLFSNKKVMFGILFEIILLSAIIYIPFLHGVFNTAPIGLRDWLYLIVLPVPMVLFEEVRKVVIRKKMEGKVEKS